MRFFSQRDEQQGSPVDTNRYAAFVSYSHAVDGELAPALQGALHRFAKPWYRVRALRVFRDEASLSANPGLWSEIESALGSSDFFILLASVDGAASKWVDREAGYWCRERSPENLLIALTDGEVAWDESAGDFDWARTTALPPSLRGAFAEEPRHIDLRWARTSEDVSLNHPGFRDSVAELAAPLHHRPKDELVGEDVRQHRRAVRLARSAVALLATLTLLAASASVLFVQQRNEAQTQRDRAEEQARLALSRQLAGEARGAPDGQMDLALLLAAQSYAIEDTNEARTALLQAQLRSPYLVGFLHAEQAPTIAAFGPDGSTLAVGGDEGEITLWDTESQEQRLTLRDHRAPITALAFSEDGRSLASGSADGVIIAWRISGGAMAGKLDTGSGSEIGAVAFSPRKSLIAAGLTPSLEEAEGENVLALWNPEDGSERARTGTGFVPIKQIAFGPNGETLTVGDGQGQMLRVDLTSDLPSTTSFFGGAGQALVAAYSADLTRFAGVPIGHGTPYITETADGSFLHEGLLQGPATSIDSMAFSGDGMVLAAAGEGKIVMWDVELGTVRPEVLIGFPRPHATGESLRRAVIAVGPDGRRVASTSAGSIVLWDLGSRALQQTIDVPGSMPATELPNAIRGAAAVAFSPDGSLLAWSLVATREESVVLWDLAEGEEVGRLPTLALDLDFSPDGTRLATTAFDEIKVWDIDTGESEPVDTIPWNQERATEKSTGEDGDTPWQADNGAGLGASISFDGTVTLWDTKRGVSLGQLQVSGATDASAFAFDPGGENLAVATPGGAVTLIQLSVESWYQRACSLAGRDMTATERTLYLGGQESVSGPCVRTE